MDQQQQGQQGQGLPTSPVRGVASNVAAAALAAGSVAVARSVSLQSADESHATSSIGTEPAREGNSHSGANIGGGGSVASGSYAENISVSGSRSGSFRASPAVTPREQPHPNSVAPFPAQAAQQPQQTPQTPQPTVVPITAPPPWPTSNTTTPAATPQRQPQLIVGTNSHTPHPTPNRTASPLPAGTAAGTASLESTPLSASPFAPSTTVPQGVVPPPPLLAGAPSFPPPLGATATGSLSLSMTQSGESLFGPPAMGGMARGGSVGSGSHQGMAPGAGAGAGPGVDSGVLLGLEELERQQADSEKRKAEKLLAEQRANRERQQQQQQMQQQQQQQQHQLQTVQGGGQQPQPHGLPPLAPSSGPPHPPPRPATAPTGGQYPEVPQQIHLTDDNEEDTILSSDVDRKELKRVTSIEKLRGSVQVGLRRFRSWSQDAMNRSSAADNPAASSVDSTQNVTEDGGGPGEQQPKSPVDTAGGQSPQQQSTPKTGNKKLGPSVVSEPYLDDDEIKPLIYGTLHKLGRNGHWQKRFFETNGERLTYYKSVKRNKVLATLDLCKVGEIAIDPTDPEECTFTIQVKNRPYYLRAEDKARCNDWVITLNRAREARLNVGNIHLNASKMEPGEGGTHRSQAGSDEYAPMIVISALRPRTRAVGSFGEGGVDGAPPDLLTSNHGASQEEGEEIEVTRWDENRRGSSSGVQGVVGVVGSGPMSPSSPPVGSEGAVAKWQKRHSKMHMLSLRFLKWARSITHQADACRREKDVVVVPAHVVQHLSASLAAGGGAPAAGATGGAAAAASAGAGGAQQGTKLPGLPEENPSPSTPPEKNVRSRANTESPAFEAC